MTILANSDMKNPEQIPDILQKYRNSRLRIGFSGGADSTALLLMLLGMVGIFVVMLLIMLTVNLLNKFAKDKDEK